MMVMTVIRKKRQPVARHTPDVPPGSFHVLLRGFCRVCHANASSRPVRNSCAKRDCGSRASASRGAVFAATAFLQDQDVVHGLHRRQAVRDNDTRTPGQQTIHRTLQVVVRWQGPAATRLHPESPGRGPSYKHVQKASNWASPAEIPLPPGSSLLSSPLGNRFNHSSMSSSSNTCMMRASGMAWLKKGQVVAHRRVEELDILGHDGDVLAAGRRAPGRAGRSRSDGCCLAMGRTGGIAGAVRVVLPLPVRPSSPNRSPGWT